MIYFVREGANVGGLVKIGWSADVVTRIRSVKPTPKAKLTIVRLIDAERWVETWFHDYFRDVRVTGEWFTYDPVMLTLWPPEKEPGPQRLLVLGWRKERVEVNITDLLDAIDAVRIADGERAREPVSRSAMIRILLRRGLTVSLPFKDTTS